MNEFHVFINLLRREDLHTPPTNMHPALWTGHMIATSILLDRDLALWTLLDVTVTLSPTIQQPLLRFRVPMYLPFLAAEPVMFLLTGNANGYEARSAPENPVSGIRFERVDFGTVGSGAVSELVGMVTKVFEEGDFQQTFEFGGRDESFYEGKGDRNATAPLIAHTRQGELFGIGGSEEEVAKAAVTIRVAASKTIRLVDRVVTYRTGFSVFKLVLGSNGARQRLVNEPAQMVTCRFPSTNGNLARE